MIDRSLNNPEKCKIGIWEEEDVNLDNALSIIGVGRYNYLVTCSCGLILFAVTTSLYGISYILPSASCELNLNTTEKGIFTGISYFGVIVGLYIWGAIADMHGRKNIMLFSLISSFICNTISIFINIFWLFCLLQFLKGLLISGASSTMYAYLGEFHCTKHRATVIAWCSFFMAFSLIALPLAAWAVLTQPFHLNIYGFKFLPWHLYLFLISAPNVFAALAVCFFPESPKYLLLRYKMSEVIKVLNKMYVANTKKSLDTCPIKYVEFIDCSNPSTELPKDNLPVHVLKMLWNQTSPLFYRDQIKYTALVCFIQFILFAIASGLILWYPYILHEVSEYSINNPNATFTVCEPLSRANQRRNSTVATCDDELMNIEVVLQNGIIGLAYCVGCAIIGFFIDVIGRRTLLVINLLVPAISCVLLTIVKNEIAIYVLFALVLVPPGVCTGIINSIIVDIFPTQFKTMAVSLSMVSGRLGGALIGTLSGLIFEFNCFGGFYAFAALLLVSIFLSSIFHIKKL